MTKHEAQFDFLQLSARTVSDQFHGHLVPLGALHRACNQFIIAGNALDLIKKLTFYGEDLERGRLGIRRTFTDDSKTIDYVLPAIAQLDDIDGPTCTPDEAQQILHAVLGVATEATEMVEALYKAVFEGGTLDLINLLEESGDTKWYLAMLCRALQVDWDDDERRVIAKLQKRYPHLFTSDAANNRDLDAERDALKLTNSSEYGRVAVAHSSVIATVGDDTASIVTTANACTTDTHAKELIADCAQQFRTYEAHHRAKGTAESLAKAEVNNEFAERCEKTLELFA